MYSLRQRVLVINSGSIFDISLLVLLKSIADLDVMDVSDQDEAALIDAIVQFTPHTVVMNDSEEGGAIRLLKIFSDLQIVQHLRVIVVQIADNVIQHYEIKQVIATESADLVALITQ
jgi:CMP-2-keto-3-deoxyoctulosonic acid synthetase